jgi:rubrerythrin
MSEKPSYLGLLNAIAVAESQAYRYLTAWIKVTKSPEVRSVLLTVAAREGEHGMSFAKRINELGYEVREKDDPAEADRLAFAASDVSDVEKMGKFGLDRLETDVLGGFDDVFKDHTIDIRTGELLGRYIAEEHDTARLLRGCYTQLKAAPSDATGSGSAASASQVASLAERVDTLGRAVEELRQIVCAQTIPADAT